MVGIHYRWDFIGLSTVQKPTPETSEKVVNGSTFYCSDNSKLYVFCDGTWYERKPLGGGGGGGSYVAGNGIDITDDTISVDTTTIQPKLTAGSNITISDQNVISATDTTYSNFTGTDGTTAGTAGLVPAPATADAGKFLKADGTWDVAGGGGGAGATILTTADYNYPENNPTSVALWLLPPGLYQKTDSSVSVKITTNTTLDSYGIVLVGKKDSIGTTIVDFEAEFPTNGGWKYGTVYIVNAFGAESAGWGLHIPADRVDKNWTTVPLAASQGKVLNDKITPSSGSTAPTTATVGILGKIYIDTSTDNAYMCTKVESGTYTWKKITA